jgi:nanoRNase/pAp phosphatase (c-di-AMP/oligoRNAs hydrolase)
MSEIASHYDGGGHQKASGFVCKIDMDELKIDLVEKLTKNN